MQPSLWDNTALETGLQYLVGLHFEEAKIQFKAALAAPNAETTYINMGLDACNFWQPRIKSLKIKSEGAPAPRPEPQQITGLLKDYKSYSFKQIRNFGNNLLSFLGEKLMSLPQYSDGGDPEKEKLQAAFFESLELLIDLLMSQKSLQLTAIKHLDAVYNKNKQHPFICFLRAEMYARHGSKIEAAKQYVHNFLHFPEGIPPDRALPDFVQKLLQQYGPYWTPVYGAVHQVLPQVKTPENIKACCLEHRAALDANHLFYEAEFLLRNKKLSAAVFIRKQIKEQYPAFFAHYHDYIHQRENSLPNSNKLP